MLAAAIAFGAFGTILEWEREGWATGVSPVAQTLEAAGAIVALWRPRLGLVIVLAPLALTLLLGNMESDLVATLVLTGAFAAMARPLEVVAVASLFLGYAVLRGLQNPPWIGMTASYLLFLVPGLLAGLLFRALLGARRRGQGRVAVMEDDTSMIRGEERARLAGELRSLVATGLTKSRIVLDGVAAEREPSRLRTAIGQVNDACLAALVEVRALVGMLREDPTAAGHDESIASPKVSEVVRRFDEQLALASVPASFAVPESFDALGRVTQTTVVKAIEEVVSATLAEHSVAGENDRPHALVAVGERRRGRIILEAEYPAPLVPEPEQRRRLERLRKRAETLGGSLRVSRHDDMCRLRLDLPLVHDGPTDLDSSGTGPRWRRWFGPGILRGLLTMGITIGGLTAGARLPAAFQAGEVPGDLIWDTAGFAVAGVLLWWPQIGAVPAAVVIVGMMITPHSDDVALVVLLLVACVQVARMTRRVAALWLGVFVFGAMVLAAVTDSGAVRERAIAAATVLLALPALMVARHFLASRQRQLSDLAALEATAEGIRLEERNLLARELHDVVAHHLSVATLQCMAYGDSEDPGELLTALGRMRRSIRGAEEEMELLSRIMSGASEPESATMLVRPTTVAKALSDTLREGGFRVAIAVDPAADDLAPPTLRTLTRAMQEGVTNILRYGRREGVCELTLDVARDATELRIRNEVPRRRRVSRLSLGYGLAGIRERVDLLGGSFSAGPENGAWVVRVTLPTTR